MIRDFFKIAWRNIVRNKFNSTIGLVGLTLGITCFLVIFQKVSYENSFDRFHSDSDRVYRIVRVTKGLAYLEGDLEYRTGVYFALPTTVKKEIPELESVTQMLYIGGESVYISDPKGSQPISVFKEDYGIAFVEPEFFDVFDYRGTDFHWIAGNPDESLSEPRTVVLTQSIAQKYFGNEDPVGKYIRIRDLRLQVTGVVSDFPYNSDFPFRLLVSLATYQEIRGANFYDWYGLSDNFQCYLKINKTSNVAQIEQKIKDIHAANTDAETAEWRMFKLQPLREVHNDSRFGNYNYRMISMGTILSLISVGVLLILMACINYSNLTVSQLSSRAKSAGIYKILGNNRRQLILQFLGESFILTLLGIFLSLFFYELVLKNFNNLIGIPHESWELLYPRHYAQLLLVAVSVTLVAGIYPAVLISRTNPVDLIQNKGFKTAKGSLRFSRFMVVFQFMIVQILVVCAFIVFQQLSYIESKDMGYNRENIITVEVPDNDPLLLERLRNSLSNQTNIADISFASVTPGQSGNYQDVSRTANGQRTSTVSELKSIDTSYIRTYGLKLIAGRNFTQKEYGQPIIVNQKLIKELYFEDEYRAIGESVEINGQQATIIGVVTDFNSDPVYDNIRPCVLDNNSQRIYMAGIKYQLFPGKTPLHQQMTDIIATIQHNWQEVFPNEVFEYHFFDQTIESYYENDKKIASLIHIFTGIMIFICCLGIIGLIHHTTNRRSKELAVRKVIGASAIQVISLLLKSLTLWVVVANLIAWPVAYFVISRWLQNFAFRIDLTIWPFLLAGISALLLALLTVGGKAIQAAVANPVNALRNE